MKLPPAASVIVEWSNALLTEADRPARMIRTVSQQIDDLQLRWAGQAGGSALFPVEVLICFDGRHVSGETISAMAPLAAPGVHGAMKVRHCDFPGAEYYDLKNRGAREAKGDVYLFVDSDVLPRPGWLESLWGMFSDPECRVAGGISYVETETLWEKATALNWVFELPPDWEETRPAERFWANNVAFRRDVFETHPYPSMNGTSRGACKWLAEQLVADCIGIHINGSARVLHPAPAGLSGFFERALAQGRDRVLWHRKFSSWWMQSAPAALLRWIKHLVRVGYATAARRRQAHVRIWQVPAVMAISWTYYTVFLFGELATHLAPAYMKRNFRV